MLSVAAKRATTLLRFLRWVLDAGKCQNGRTLLMNEPYLVIINEQLQALLGEY